MGFWGFLGILALVIIACRALAEAFPVIRPIMILASWIFAIVIGISNGFWWGVLALIGAAAVSCLLFGTEEESKTKRGNTVKCADCGCTHVKIVEESDEAVVYKCPDCGTVGSYLLRR